MTFTEHSRLLYLLDGLDRAPLSVCRRLIEMGEKPEASRGYQEALERLRGALTSQYAIRAEAKQLRQDML